MFNLTKVLCILILTQQANSELFINTSSIASKNDRCAPKIIEQSRLNPIRSLQVSANHYVPFIYKDKSGKLSKGIEYKLVEIIAEKLRVTLSLKELKYGENFDGQKSLEYVQ